jgi:predicted Fe-S protein YdhL (DUF1289 family)
MTSPCVSICHLNDEDICLGCYRSGDEITAWKGLDNEAHKQILIKAQERKLTLNVPNSY